MNFKEIELKIDNEVKVIKFRLTSEYACALETETGKSLLEFLDNEKITMVVEMLRYMRAWEEPSFSIKDAQKLYDVFINNGWTFKKIVQDVIYETLVVSGFLEKADWEETKKQTEEITKRLKENFKKEVLEKL